MVLSFNALWRLTKGIIKVLLGKDGMVKPKIALFRGFLSGTGWIFNQKPETGYNPYINK